MGWSSKLFLLTPDDVPHRLAGSAFTRMLRSKAPCRLPGFAGQRVRMASVTIEVVDRLPLGVRHASFTVVDFNAHGRLDVARLNAQQVAHLDTMVASTLGAHVLAPTQN